MSPPLRPVAEHRDAVVALARTREPETVGIGEALGRVLAADVVAAVDLPGFDNSAMDGYAVRSSECADGAVLPVAGDIAAGDTHHWDLPPGSALRIMTGAPMPAGADSVVPVEATDGGETQVRVGGAPTPGQHVRRRGEDVRAGEVVVRSGKRITPGRVALIAAANVAEVVVAPQPRVAIYATGDELVSVGSELANGQIVDSNAVMLAALVRAAGAQVGAVGRLTDSAEDTRRLLSPGPDIDVVITTGGVSMGAYDTVKEVLSSTGTVEFVKVAMKPGMPQGCGTLGRDRTPVVTLPGNPVSSLVSFHVFVVPLLRAIAGVAAPGGGQQVVVAQGWGAAAGKTEFTRVVVGEDGARPCTGQGSHMLAAFTEATHLAVVEADVTQVGPGDTVQVMPLLGQDGACGS